MPESLCEEGARLKEQPRRKTQREQLEELFDAVVGEIEEREAFLHEMRAHGRGDRYEHAIRAEIAERGRSGAGAVGGVSVPEAD